jgi:hypothetical protein
VEQVGAGCFWSTPTESTLDPEATSSYIVGVSNRKRAMTIKTDKMPLQGDFAIITRYTPVKDA